MEIFKLKTKLGEVMNLALEFGKADLLDRVELIIGANEISDLKKDTNRQTFCNKNSIFY